MSGSPGAISHQWNRLASSAPLIAGSAALAVSAAGLFVFISDKPVKWLVGLALLTVALTALVLVQDKKLFLLSALFGSFVIRTTVNLWMPTATRYSTGSSTTTSAVELFPCDPFLLLLTGYLVATRRSEDSRLFRSTDIAAVAFLCFCALSLLNSSYPGLTLVRLPVIARLPLIYYCFSRGITSRRDVRIVSYVLIAAVFVESALAIVQTQFGTLSWMSSIVESDAQTTTQKLYGIEAARATGTIGYTTVFAQWLGMLSPIALAFLLFSRNTAGRLLAGVAYSTAGVALILSISRAEWINLPIVFGVLFLVSIAKASERRWSSFAVFAAMFTVMCGAVAYKYELILARLTAPDSDSAYIRIPMMQVASRIIADNPIFGVGLHNYTQIMRSYGIARLLPGWDYGVHNSFLYLLAETGIFALLSLVAMWCISFKRLVLCIRRDTDIVSTMAAGMLCGLTALLLHSQVEEGFHVHQVLSNALWAFFGLAAALTQLSVTREHWQHE